MSKPLARLFATQGHKYIGTTYGTGNGELDCQALVEAMLDDVGVLRNWKGSNAMWRDMLWTGTPEECKRLFGCVPVGAWLYIIKNDGGEIARGYTDGRGNASHVGVKTGVGDGAIHSSSSRGCVCESKFQDKTIKNGGWNAVGLSKLLDYGAAIEARLRDATGAPDNPTNPSPDPAEGTSGSQDSSYVELGSRLLKRGAQGEDVRQLQERLIQLGYNLGGYGINKNGADGIYGAKTIEAVRCFQKAYGLHPDGEFGKLTYATLIDVLDDDDTANKQRPFSIVVTSWSVNVRDRPDMINGNVVRVVRMNKRLTATDVDAETGWYQLEDGNFISNEFTKRV